MRLLLMPGMDGTGRLFARFQKQLPTDFVPEIVSYSPDLPLSYEQLQSQIKLPSEPFGIIAESFSGPLAIRLACEHEARIKALVLVSTFVSSPRAPLRMLTNLPWGLLFSIPPSAALLRWTVLDRTSPEDQAGEVRENLRSVSPNVLAKRLRDIARVDVSRDFAATRVPTLCLAGTKDRLLPKKVFTRFRELRSDIEVRTLDAPHLVLQERPSQAAEIIVEFLRRITGGT